MVLQETVLCSATKDPKHVLQDESLYGPCFFNTSYVFRWSLFKCHATKTTTRAARYISLVSSEIQK